MTKWQYSVGGRSPHWLLNEISFDYNMKESQQFIYDNAQIKSENRLVWHISKITTQMTKHKPSCFGSNSFFFALWSPQFSTDLDKFCTSQ